MANCIATLTGVLLPLVLLLAIYSSSTRHPILLCRAARSVQRQSPADENENKAAPRAWNLPLSNGAGVTRSDFPEDFLFGAITSSMKHEGAGSVDLKTDNIWDVYARKDGASMDGSVPGECGDNYHLFKTDHKLMADLGMNSYRFSLAWSRIFPNGSGEVNELAIAHYNEVIDDSLEQGLVPMVSLWTQDHPQALEVQYGGALDAQFITDFANYAETCFKAFGDRVKYWITFDEPNDWAALGYSTDANPPGRCTSGIVGQSSMLYGDCDKGDSGTEPYIVARNLLLAHAEAVDIYRTNYQPSQNGSVGLALWFRWWEPLTNSSADIGAAQRATDFLVGWFLDPIFFGKYPDSMVERVGSRLPNFTAEEMSKIQGSLDYIGLNIITAGYVFDKNLYLTPEQTCYYLDWGVDSTADKDGVQIGPGKDTFAVPWCIRRTVEYVKERYSNFPMYITQTGWGMTFNKSEESITETLDDDERVHFYETYYEELSQAIKEGANVKGVYAWSLIDGFEFDLGMGVRVGMYYVDSQYNRYPRLSSLWFKQLLSQNTSITLAAQL